MQKKQGNFIEDHIEKIVFGVVGLLSSFLLYVFVLSSPYSVEYNDKKVGPGDIDKEIEIRAQRLSDTLDRAPKPKAYPEEKKSKDFVEKFT